MRVAALYDIHGNLPALEAVLQDIRVSVVVCGHTHMQFDRMIGRTRVVNAGSVGEPYGEPGAYWLLLGPDVHVSPPLPGTRVCQNPLNAILYRRDGTCI